MKLFLAKRKKKQSNLNLRLIFNFGEKKQSIK